MDEILKKLLDEINDAYDKTQGYIVYDLLKAVSLVMADYDIKLTDIKNLLDVDNLTGTMLETYVYQRKGIERIQANNAIGELSVTGNGSIHVGDLFETKSGIQFMSSETKAITGTGTINIKAVIAGASGNIPANQIAQMPVTLSGITAVTNPQPTHEGYEAEFDESLRERYYIAVRTPATSNNIDHYRQWAKSITGVGAVKIFPEERGQNTVEVVLIDQNKQPASATLVNAVQEYIDPDSTGLGYGQASIGNKTYVLSAMGLDVDITVSIIKEIGYSDAQVKTNIENSIREYLKTIAFVQSYVSYAAIGNTIFETVGVQDYSALIINGGTSNITIGDKEVAVLGDVILA